MVIYNVDRVTLRSTGEMNFRGDLDMRFGNSRKNFKFAGRKLDQWEGPEHFSQRSYHNTEYCRNSQSNI